jgi:hypothetical protein
MLCYFLVKTVDCPDCVKLKNMLNSENIIFQEFFLKDLPPEYKKLVTCFPTLLYRNVLVIPGCPSTKKDLMNYLDNFSN